MTSNYYRIHFRILELFWKKYIVRFCSNFMLRTFTWLRSILDSFNKILKYFDQRHLTEEIWDLWKSDLPAINSISFSYPNFKILESSIDKILEMLQWTPRQLTPLKCFHFGVDFGSARVESRKHEKMTLKWRYQGGMKNKARHFRKNLTQKV